ncbi:MAG: hypothetical protein WCH99_16295 [Verrucomicrobiota bacterium]
MSKNASLYCLLGLVLGLGIGYFYAQARAGRAATNAYATFKMTELGEASERAQQAYKHEIIPVAIYAMSELADKLKAAEQTGTQYMSRQMLSFDLMLAHARLGKLYGQAGQTNLNAEHVAEALRYAKTGSNPAITNSAMLMDLVARIDKGAR